MKQTQMPGLRARAVSGGAVALASVMIWAAPAAAETAGAATSDTIPALAASAPASVAAPTAAAPSVAAPPAAVPSAAAPSIAAASSASVAPAPRAVPGLQTSDAPIELDGYALAGETRAEPAAPPSSKPELHAVVMASAADGLGLGGQLSRGPFGLRATLTYQPLTFIVDEDPNDATFGSFEFAHSLQLNLDAMLVGTESGKGASLGYRYNDLLGHGASVAYQWMFDAWGERFNLSFPVAYYPQATGRVRERLDLADSYKINFPFGAGVEYGIGITWIL